MDLNNLRTIQLLVADPNLSRTAERLHMTQSALSKRVHAIEEELGCLLFERRGPRGLKPMQQALDLVGIAEKVLSTWDAGVKRIKSSATEPEHFVLVGPQLFLREIVLPWWTKMAPKFPSLQFEVQVSSLERVSLDTVKAGADAGILEHKEELADFVCKSIYTEHWGIVRHPSLAKSVTASDMRAYKWGTYSVRENPVDTWLVQRQIIAPPHYHLFWQDLTAIAVWVSETPGAASVLPWHTVVWLAKRNKVLFEPLGPDAKTRLYLAYPRNSPHSVLLEALSKIAEEAHTQQASKPQTQKLLK